MKNSLILSTYNKPEHLDCILNHLARGSRIPDQIVVSDDGSGEETKKVIENWKEKLPITHSWQEDDGFRKNRILNLSITKATGDYLIFLDGDCIPSKNFVEDHLKQAQQGYFVQGRRAYILEEAVPDALSNYRSPVYYFLRRKLSGTFKALRLPIPLVFVNQKQRGLIGCNMAMWKQDLIDINGFDETYEGWGIGEDSDVCTRLYHKGIFRKFVYGRAIIYHLNHPELSKDHQTASQKKLQETIDSKRVICEKGLSEHLS